MNSSWLYQLNTIWVVAALVLAMTLAGEIGCRLGRRWHPRTDDARRGHIAAVLGSLLGLLALLLSFTFAMSASRYDARRHLVVREANVLGGLYLQSSLLPDAPRKTFKTLLNQYVDLRAQIAFLHHDTTDAETARAAARSDDVLDQMWMVVKGVMTDQLAGTANFALTEVVNDMFERTIEAMSIQRERLFAWEGRVPDPVICLLLFGAVTAMTVIGFFGGLGNHRGLPARIALTLLLCATIYVILDLDKPHQGFIRVSQSPMLHLKRTLDRDPEARP